MTCGQPYGNHCIEVHCKIQFSGLRFEKDRGPYRKLIAEERAKRMAQMGWTEEERKSEGEEWVDSMGVAARATGLHCKGKP